MAKRSKRGRWPTHPIAVLVLLLASFAFAALLPDRALAQESDADAETVEQTEALPTAGYSRGFFIQSSDGDFQLRMKGRVQLRLTGVFPDEGDAEGSFMLRRVRMRFYGNAFGDWLTYLIQLGWDQGWVSVVDFWTDVAIVPDRLHFRFGQFRRPFSRDEIISGGRLQLVERSLLTSHYGTGRDLGIALHSNYERCPPFEWMIAVMNGTGVSSNFDGEIAIDSATSTGEVIGGRFSNVPDVFHPSLVARVGYNHGEIRGYELPDLDGGPLRFALAASGWLDFDADGGDDGFVAAEVDGLLKVAGLTLFAEAAVAFGQDGEAFTDLSHSAWSLTTELGYVIAGLVGPAIRFTHLDPDGDDNNRSEATVGLSFYFIDHALKWQTDATAILREHEDGTATDWRVRSQLQLWF